MPDDTLRGPEDGRIEAAVPAVIGSMSGELSAAEAALLAEIQELGRTVARAKQEVARLRIDEITERHIPGANDELDAIIQHTAHATNEILDCCEALEELRPRISHGEAQALQSVTTRIYEACGFQDITGQRIGTVVAALKAIEARVASIIGLYKESREASVPTAPLTKGSRLTEGPQLPGAGISQADVDRLLAES
jgi:chemotaxis protein CheZ